MKVMIQKRNPAVMKLTERKTERMAWGPGSYFIAGSETGTTEKLGTLLLIQNFVNVSLLDYHLFSTEVLSVVHYGRLSY